MACVACSGGTRHRSGPVDRELDNRILSDRLHAEALRRLSANPDVPHPLISRFEMPGQTARVEQRMRHVIALEPMSQLGQSSVVARELQREGLIAGERVRHQICESDSMQLAGGNAPRKG